jgi:hypothetical protein
MPNANVGKTNIQDMVLILQKTRRVFVASLSQSSVGQKRIVGLKN